jgi:hypothetical protein
MDAAPGDTTPATGIATALEALHEAGRTFAEVPLVRALYQELVPSPPVPAPLAEAVGTTLAKIASLLPDHQIHCLRAADPHPAVLDKIVIYRAALRRVTGDTLWLHHDLAYRLNHLIEIGQDDARAPCLTHCWLALELARGEHPGPYLRNLAARLLRHIAPREAIRDAIIAVNGGHAEAMDVIRGGARQLGIIGPEDWLAMRVSDIKRVEDACQLPPSTSFGVIAPAAASGHAAGMVTDPGEAIVPPPIGDDFYYMFRNAGQPISLPAVTVHALEGGIVSFDLTHLGRTQFYVFDRDGACVEELSWGIRPFIDDPGSEMDGDVCLIGDRFSGAMNVCHFLLDHLTRVALYDRFAPGARILLTDPHQTYLNICARAGLSSRLVEPGAKRFSIRAGRLLVASNIIADLRHPAHLGADWAINFLRDRFDIGLERWDQDRRIFISRADSRSRNILNWPEIEPLLAARGFQVVALSGLTLAEQMALFASAECVAGVHGAGLANVIFSPPGLKILEILPQMVASPAYWYLCHAAGHHYHALVASDPEIPVPDYASWTHQALYNDRDIVIDPARLAVALDRLLLPPVE